MHQCLLLVSNLPASTLKTVTIWHAIAHGHGNLSHESGAFLQGYVDVFTKSMQVELAQSGISVQNMAPLFVATKMSKIRTARIDAPSPTQWANAAVKHIGYETTSSPWWFHALQWYFISIGPVFLLNGYTLNLHLGMQKRYYKKLAKASKST